MIHLRKHLMLWVDQSNEHCTYDSYYKILLRFCVAIYRPKNLSSQKIHLQHIRKYRGHQNL